jgi:hypothetical protein
LGCAQWRLRPACDADRAGRRGESPQAVRQISHRSILLRVDLWLKLVYS